MSMELVFKQAYEGTAIATGYAQIRLNQAIEEYGKEHKVGYPGTSFHLPVIEALDGTKVKTLGQLVKVLNDVKSECVRADYTAGGALLNGKSTLFAAEIIEALNYLDGEPYQAPWVGFIPDEIVSAVGAKIVDNSITGIAILLGRAKDNDTAAELLRELQSKGILTVLVNEVTEQLLDAGVELGAGALAVPLGNFTQVIHAVNFAMRAAFALGGIAPGDLEKHLEFQKQSVKAFVIALGNLDNVRIAAACGALYLGHPTITDQALPEGGIPGALMHETDPKKIVALGMKLRGIA